MNIEKKRIILVSTSKGLRGHIELEKIAIPETVKVTLGGQRVIPQSFDIYGQPIFTAEQAMLVMFKEEELSRKNGKYTPLEVEIEYKERIFNVPRSSFDTVEGIRKSLLNLFTLNNMLNNRRLFVKANNEERLNEFMIFGCFMLDQFGQIMSIDKSYKKKIVSTSDVEEFAVFKSNNNHWQLVSDGFVIPGEHLNCPCCGTLITISDLTDNPCVYVDGKVYHDTCYRNYRKLTEVDKLTRQMMNCIYKDTDYQFELLPNGYCNRECCSHIPWILFHTVDGDIIIGWRKRVISIEWQENYKPFDINELFGAEDVTKWNKDGKRGIHAWGNKKALEYLDKVLNNVNPNYSKY